MYIESPSLYNSSSQIYNLIAAQYCKSTLNFEMTRPTKTGARGQQTNSSCLSHWWWFITDTMKDTASAAGINRRRYNWSTVRQLWVKFAKHILIRLNSGRSFRLERRDSPKPMDDSSPSSNSRSWMSINTKSGALHPETPLASLLHPEYRKSWSRPIVCMNFEFWNV
jgi:hypothetical protein